MKHYQLTIGVPDDFDPDKMEVNINYPDGDIVLEGEGYHDFTELAEKATLQLEDIKPTDVVIFKYTKEFATTAPLAVDSYRKLLEAKLGCTVVGLVDDMKLLVKNSAEATAMLQRMIDKVNAKAIIKMR